MLNYAFDSGRVDAVKQKILEVVFEILVAILKIDGSSVMLADEKGEEIVIVASAEHEFQEANRKIGIAVKVGDRVAGRAFKNNEPILIIGDVSSDERFKDLKKYEEIYSGMSVPVRKEGKVVGVLNTKRVSSEEPFSTDDLNFVEKIATVLGKFI